MKGWGVRVRRVAAEVCWLAGWGFDFSSCESLVKCCSIWKAKQQSSQEPLPAACNFHSTPLKRRFLKLGYFQDDPSLPKKIAKDNPRVSEDFRNWPEGSRIRPKTTRRLLPMIIEDHRLLRITDRNLKLKSPLKITQLWKGRWTNKWKLDATSNELPFKCAPWRPAPWISLGHHTWKHGIGEQNTRLETAWEGRRAFSVASYQRVQKLRASLKRPNTFRERTFSFGSSVSC